MTLFIAGYATGAFVIAAIGRAYLAYITRRLEGIVERLER